MMQSTEKSTRKDMEFEIRYSIRLLTLHANLARNTDRILNTITLLGLTSGVSSMISQSELLAVVTGFFLSIVAITQVLFKPAEIKIKALFSKQHYDNLLGKAHTLSDAELGSELGELHRTDLHIIEGLRLVAQIDTCHELGLDETEFSPMNKWNRFLKLFS